MRQTGFRELPFGKKLLKTFLQWLPYLAVLGAFMFWRIFIFKFPGYQPVLLDEFSSGPLDSVLGIFVRIIEDAYTATWGAWTEFFRFPNHNYLETASGKIFWAAAAFSFAAAVIAAFFYRPDEQESENSMDEALRSGKNWCLIAMGLGAFMVICPGLPYWVTSLPIQLAYPYDRFLVAFIFGSSIFLTGLIGFFIRTRWQRNLILCLFLAMAVGGNILNANSYRKDWKVQKMFADQLSTRIPSLKQSTLLLADDNPLSYESDNSLTGMVNLILDPDHEGNDLPYSIMLFTPHFGTIENYETRPKIYQEFRDSLFGVKNDEVIVYHYSPPGCLRILDPEQHSYLNIFPESYKHFMYLSDPKGRIDPFGGHSTYVWDKIFKEPVEENWCYYFETADLARQTEDWEKIAAIGDEVLPTMKAGEVSEYFIFIEAYMNLDRWDDAMELFKRVHSEDKSRDQDLCTYLRMWVGNHQPEDHATITHLITAMNSVGCALVKN